MFDAILTPQQVKLLPFVSKFKQEFILVGGTCLALQLGHRRSIDFDLFSFHPFDTQKILESLKRLGILQKTMVSGINELTVLAGDTKFTWYQYKYPIIATIQWEHAQLVDIKTIGAMKLFALGGRSKWKDYVDLFFIFQQFSLEELLEEAKRLFAEAFNEKLARVQLSYFEDINYSESVDLMPEFQVADDVIKDRLTKISIS